eukprot:2406047-Pleurochrysis_carterae.AAC.2
MVLILIGAILLVLVVVIVVRMIAVTALAHDEMQTAFAVRTCALHNLSSRAPVLPSATPLMVIYISLDLKADELPLLADRSPASIYCPSAFFSSISQDFYAAYCHAYSPSQNAG